MARGHSSCCKSWTMDEPTFEQGSTCSWTRVPLELILVDTLRRFHIKVADSAIPKLWFPCLVTAESVPNVWLHPLDANWTRRQGIYRGDAISFSQDRLSGRQGRKIESFVLLDLAPRVNSRSCTRSTGTAGGEVTPSQSIAVLCSLLRRTNGFSESDLAF